MRKIFILLILIAVPAFTSAGVYKWVDADGAVHFSDVPQEGAEEVHIAPPQSYSAPSLPPITPRTEQPEVPPEYSSFVLQAPEPEANIWDNEGLMEVSFAISPPLQTDRGHKLVVLLDGQQHSTAASSSVSLQNIDRGSHDLQGRIVDSLGNVLMTSQSITVHMHRQSVLAPNRVKPKP